VYSAARGVVDAMRHRHRIGETLALAALGRYLRRDGRSMLTHGAARPRSSGGGDDHGNQKARSGGLA
jgi:hypothetical protein